MNLCALRPCFVDHLWFVSDFCQVPRRNLWKFLLFFIHCCLCGGYLHCLRHRNKFVYQTVMLQWIVPLFLQYGPHDILVEILPYAFLVDSLASKIHAKFRLEIISLATGLPMLAFLACLARHGGSHWCFQFLSSISNGFLELLLLRVNEIDSSLPSSIIELWFFNWSFMLLPQLSIPCHSSPEFLAMNDLAWMSLAVLSVSPQTTYILLEVSPLIE